MSRQQTRRKCRCCTKFFIPDPRNQTRQHYCPQPACRQASKAASQRRWLSKAANSDYFRGADQVLRVQLWRKSHPGCLIDNSVKPSDVAMPSHLSATTMRR